MSQFGRFAKQLTDLVSTNKGSRFRQNFLKVAWANGLAQALTVLAAPLLTRLYSPADFGVASLFYSLISILLPFSTWRVDWSIPNAKSRTQSAALIALGAIALIFSSITVSILFGILGTHWLFWKGFEGLEPFLLLIPIALFGSGTYQLLEGWFIREASLTAVSYTKVAQSTARTGLNIAGGIVGLGAFGLIASSVVSAWVGVGVLFRNANGLWAAITRLSLRRIRAGWLRFGTESTLSVIVNFVNIASLSAPPLLLIQHYSATEVGWYALMYQLAIAPIAIFTGALNQSFWAEAAQLVKSDRRALQVLYMRTTKRLLFACLPIIIICAAGPIFVGPLLGETEWVRAGYVLPAILPMVIGSIAFSSTNHLIVLGKQHWQLVGDSVRLFLIITSVAVAQMAMIDFVMAVLLISLSSLLGHLILFLMHIKAHGSHE